MLDNASIHHGQPVQAVCDEFGVILFYLPPYSPDLNPCELSYAYAKQQLARYDLLIAEMIDDFSFSDWIDAVFEAIPPQHCNHWFRHCISVLS